LVARVSRYSRACGFYQDFLDRGLLLTRQLLNRWFILLMLKSSLRKFYTKHLCHQVFCGVRVTRSLDLYVMLCISLFVLLSFFLSVFVLSVLRYTDSDYRFGNFKLLTLWPHYQDISRMTYTKSAI